LFSRLNGISLHPTDWSTFRMGLACTIFARHTHARNLFQRRNCENLAHRGKMTRHQELCVGLCIDAYTQAAR
jgi:hypothetical protein